MSEKYTNLILRLSAFGKVLNKHLRASYFIPKKYDKIKLPTFLDTNQINQLAIHLDMVYELHIDESGNEGDSDEDLEENYVEINGELISKIRLEYLNLLQTKEFIVLQLDEGIDIENTEFSTVELKIENLSLKSNIKK